MSEISQSSENLKIPENWKFPERDQPDLKPVQVESDSRFLAFTVPDGRHQKSVEYFFDNEGEISGYCITPLVGNISVGLTTDSRSVYDFHRYASLDAPKVIDVTVIFKNSELSDETLEDRIGYIGSLYGNVYLVNVDSVFLKQSEEEKEIKSPRFGLRIENGEVKFDAMAPKAYFEDRNEYIVENFVIRKKTEQTAEIFDKGGKQIFGVEWRTEESDKDEGGGQFLVINQTHIPTGIVKTLRSPLRFNLGKITESLSVGPPYNKEKKTGKEVLVVPWRNIDRIVGASISYSYSPQKQ